MRADFLVTKKRMGWVWARGALNKGHLMVNVVTALKKSKPKVIANAKADSVAFAQGISLRIQISLSELKKAQSWTYQTPDNFLHVRAQEG